jgi:ParB/RepB/Spo0J family partition protein
MTEVSTVENGQEESSKTRNGVLKKALHNGITARKGNTIKNDRTVKNGSANRTDPANRRNANADEKATNSLVGTESNWKIVWLSVDLIDPSPYQPRLSFDADEMAELVASVRVHDVQQPIIVRSDRNDKALEKEALRFLDQKPALDSRTGRVPLRTKHIPLQRYQLVAGERRLRACKEAGRKFIPAIVRDDLSDAQAAELALVENIQRSNLTVIEEGRGYRRLMLEFRMKEERIAKKIGKSVQTVKDTIKLLALPEAVQILIAEKKLTASHGHALLALAPFEPVCVAAAERAVRDRLTATSLTTDPLPNAKELRMHGTVVELDHRTEFDWKSECAACPFKAYVASGYRSYCLKPDEWQKKQHGAVELKKQEAARVMEEARQEGKQAVEMEQLPPGSYRDLAYATIPAGCSEGCSCRGESCDPRDPTRTRPVCLDPKRYGELVQAERQAQEETRKRHFLALWCEAKEKLIGQQESGDERTIVSLLAYPSVLVDQYSYRGTEPGLSFMRQIGDDLAVELPWESLFDEEVKPAQALQMFQQADARRLLLYLACLLLAEEAAEAVRYARETPLIDAVLGRTDANQVTMEEDDGEQEDDGIDAPQEDSLNPATSNAPPDVPQSFSDDTPLGQADAEPEPDPEVPGLDPRKGTETVLNDFRDEWPAEDEINQLAEPSETGQANSAQDYEDVWTEESISPEVPPEANHTVNAEVLAFTEPFIQGERDSL